VPESDEVPDLPYEITVGAISLIHQDWWFENPDALRDAEDVAAWLDFHIERRNAGETKSEQPVERLTLTVEQAAEALGISRAFAYEAVARGDIPCIRIGRRVLIPKIALEKMLDGAK
jgi:excisionase family DNA binding protein